MENVEKYPIAYSYRYILANFYVDEKLKEAEKSCGDHFMRAVEKGAQMVGKEKSAADALVKRSLLAYKSMTAKKNVLFLLCQIASNLFLHHFIVEKTKACAGKK